MDRIGLPLQLLAAIPANTPGSMASSGPDLLIEAGSVRVASSGHCRPTLIEKRGRIAQALETELALLKRGQVLRYGRIGGAQHWPYLPVRRFAMPLSWAASSTYSRPASAASTAASSPRDALPLTPEQRRPRRRKPSAARSTTAAVPNPHRMGAEDYYFTKAAARPS